MPVYQVQMVLLLSPLKKNSNFTFEIYLFIHSMYNIVCIWVTLAFLKTVMVISDKQLISIYSGTLTFE